MKTIKAALVSFVLTVMVLGYVASIQPVELVDYCDACPGCELVGCGDEDYK